MKKPNIIALAALSKDTRYIGKDNDLLWHNPEDLKRVKALTTGYPLIMGRKTYESIGRPLPNRTNIILTRDTNYAAAGCIVVNTTEEALAEAKSAEGGAEKIFIFGGSEIYKLFLPITDKLILTIVDSDREGTHTFPEFENDFIESERHGGGIFDEEKFEWVDYMRKS